MYMICKTTALKLYTAIFFSSRRRHTRYWRDWSSDVCSSDLPRGPRRLLRGRRRRGHRSDPAEARRGAHAGRLGERRVGEEGRSRWAPDYLKKKNKHQVDHLIIVLACFSPERNSRIRRVVTRG